MCPSSSEKDGLGWGKRTHIVEPTEPIAHCIRRGFTLIEVLIVIAIITVLIALLVPAITLVRAKAHDRQAAQTVAELVQAIEAYRSEDASHRYPPVQADASLSLRAVPGPGVGVLELLDQRGLWSPAAAVKDADSRLIDPFRSPYRYSLTRPAPAQPADALQDWNWDPAQNRVRAWGRRPQADGTIADGPLAFAYVWSLGRAADPDDATTWVYVADR